MKKFVALSLAMMLALAMCLPVFARYEGCMYCESRLKTVIDPEPEIVYVPCSVVEGEMDTWVYTYEEEYCIKNDHFNSRTLIRQEYICGHTPD